MLYNGAKSTKVFTEYKVQAVKLSKEIGSGAHTPDTALSLAVELAGLRKQIKELEKENRRLKEENEFLEEVSKNQRLMLLAIKTEDGRIKGKLSFYCRMLKVSRQGFCKYLSNKDRPWKFGNLADAIRAIKAADILL